MRKQVTDVVCGMTIPLREAAGKTTHAGREYYFCGPSCQREFERSPEPFVDTESRSKGGSKTHSS